MPAEVVDPVRYGSRYGSAGTSCRLCGAALLNSRASYCSSACRQRAHRLRHQSPVPDQGAPVQRPLVAYECPACEARLLGEQYCHDCHTFARRLGPGGPCPHCDEVVAVADLLTRPYGI